MAQTSNNFQVASWAWTWRQHRRGAIRWLRLIGPSWRLKNAPQDRYTQTLYITYVTYIHACIHTYIHPYLHTYIHKYITLYYICVCIYTYITSHCIPLHCRTTIDSIHLLNVYILYTYIRIQHANKLISSVPWSVLTTSAVQGAVGADCRTTRCRGRCLGELKPLLEAKAQMISSRVPHSHVVNRVGQSDVYSPNTR